MNRSISVVLSKQRFEGQLTAAMMFAFWFPEPSGKPREEFKVCTKTVACTGYLFPLLSYVLMLPEVSVTATVKEDMDVLASICPSKP